MSDKAAYQKITRSAVGMVSQEVTVVDVRLCVSRAY